MMVGAAADVGASGRRRCCPKWALDLQGRWAGSGSASDLGCVLTWGGSSGQRARSQARGAQTQLGHGLPKMSTGVGQVRSGQGGEELESRCQGQAEGSGHLLPPTVWAPGTAVGPGIMTRSSGNGYIYKAGWHQPGPSTQPFSEALVCRLPAPDLSINPGRGCSATIR